MSPAQLSRLRPQISALSSLFEDPDSYIKSLSILLEKYQSDIGISADGISPYTLVKKFNVPEIVISQLGVSFNHLVKTYSIHAIEIAGKLWEKEQLEYKLLSLKILSKLPVESLDVYFDHIKNYIDADTDFYIFSSILDASRSNPSILGSSTWLNIIFEWASAQEARLKKIGIKAIREVIEKKEQYPPPQLMKRITPIFLSPSIAINGELYELVKVLAKLSINETTAFLISMGMINPNPDISKFLRKCAPLFPEALAEKVKIAGDN